MNNDLRVAWLLPAFKYYWQPAIIEFSKNFTNTKVFTGLFPGFMKGLENQVEVEVVGEFKTVGNNNQKGYPSVFTFLSPKIIGYLIKFKPKIIFSSSFGVWTIIALFLKLFYGWRVVIAYEGSSPGVDFRHSTLRLFLRQMMIKIADAYITNSQRGKEYLIDILNAPSDLVFAHPYEIPPLELLAQKSEEKNIDFKPEQRPVFLYVGQIIRRKGIDILLDACLKLNQQGQDNYTVLIVGDGLEKESLAAFCQTNNLQNNVKWLGILEYAKIASLYQQSDIFVLPTREDTWGVVTLEAMLFGKPVICSNGAGSSELIKNGENGYVFDINQSDELSELMNKFINNTSLIHEMGISSQQKMHQYNPQGSGIFLQQVLESCFLSPSQRNPIVTNPKS